MEATLLFPHQLYHNHPALSKDRVLILYEDPLYFNQFKFHKLKLILHRASMKSWESVLRKKGYDVTYLSVHEAPALANVFDLCIDREIDTIHYTDTNDYLVQRRLERYSLNSRIKLKKYRSPNFLLDDDEFVEAIGPKKKYFMASFYIHQRKKFQILVENGSEPVGSKWSFDPENRKRLPASVKVRAIQPPGESEFVREARKYVKLHFAGNYGTDDIFPYPINHHQAEQWLDQFLIKRLASFGDYEDAISAKHHFLFHSVLTPSLNIGLLSPQQILKRTFELNNEYHFPLNSLEGFIRQIIGWREFMRGLYVQEGVYMRKRNALNATRNIPKSFWKGETGIVPVDHTISKILKTGYAHHIERLMVMGNIMNLCGFHPDEVYRWFMELFIDAYDWVMVPNVYGMSQYAGDDLMTTKPYISGSNYVLKMSDYKKGDWCAIWDALYWRYLLVHQDKFKGNVRMKMVFTLLDKMGSKKRNEHLSIAENFLASL